MNVKLMAQVEAAGSRLEKERLLAQETDTRFLRWALDPMVTFGVTADAAHLVEQWRDPGYEEHRLGTTAAWWDSFDRLLQELSRRALTGNAALISLAQTLMMATSEEHVLWACRVVNRDLRCGVQVTTANKVFPGLIEPFAVMLAQEYDPERHDLLGSWVAQPKLDGLRMVVVDGRAYSRGGREIETVGHILKELEHLAADCVFDGEVMGQDEFDASSGRTRRKGVGPDETLTYHVFDVVARDQWARKQTVPLCKRLPILQEMFVHGYRHVRAVPTFEVPRGATAQELTELFRDRFVAQGHEGAMLKDVMSPYVFKRSDRLLKFKPFQDADLRVVGFQEGRGRHRGRCGALICEDENGVRTRVGSGLDDGQRAVIWDNQGSFLGRTAEVKYQNRSANGVLRFPTFVRWRHDK